MLAIHGEVQFDFSAKYQLYLSDFSQNMNR